MHHCTGHNHNPVTSSFRLVIMTLVDVANGRNRHVPYRDSRLTFLLQVKYRIKKMLLNGFVSSRFPFFSVSLSTSFQDSLGGNSKTTIVANVSPSIWYPSSLCSFFFYIYHFCRYFTMCLTHLWILYCSSTSETLSTLKFAQRAKLIQNNVLTFQVYKIC